jgi:hypothetical protein
MYTPKYGTELVLLSSLVVGCAAEEECDAMIESEEVVSAGAEWVECNTDGDDSESSGTESVRCRVTRRQWVGSDMREVQVGTEPQHCCDDPQVSIITAFDHNCVVT